MSEGGESLGVGKSERPKVKKKSGIGGQKSEEENNSAFNIPNSKIKKSEIENPKSEIKVEVHHHPEVEKKGLKEYLLEGLMIFSSINGLHCRKC